MTIATCAECAMDVSRNADGWWVDERGRLGFKVIDEWHQHRPLGASLPSDSETSTG